MPTSVTFETAALQSSLSKAEAVAPDKAGNAHDKAAGVLFEISPADEAVVLRSTNLDVYYLEWLDALESSGEHVMWRLPSRVLASFVKSLPIGSGKTVTMTQEGTAVQFSSGRTKARLQLMDASRYHAWQPFDEAGMTEIKDFGSRIAQVEWAASRDVIELGVRLEADYVCATDRYRLAVAPIKIEGLVEGITIPPATLSTVIRPLMDVKLRVEATQLLVMPDDHTQLRCVIIGEKYPPVRNLMIRKRAQVVKFKKGEMTEVVKRALSISTDRSPRLRLIIGRGEFAAMVVEAQTGHVGDVISLNGQADHPRCEINIVPNIFLEAIQNSPSEEVEMGYDPADPKKGKLYFNGGSGYEVWAVPLGDTPSQAESKGDER